MTGVLISVYLLVELFRFQISDYDIFPKWPPADSGYGVCGAKLGAWLLPPAVMVEALQNKH